MESRVVMLACFLVACGHAATPATTTPAAPGVHLAVLAAESDTFPGAARALTAQMAAARVAGVDTTQVSKVSLEVVQLSIECNDPTPACFHAVGKSLAANRLLFARVGPGTKKGQVKVIVTLFDVDTSAATSEAEQVFPSETKATAAVAKLVGQATQP